MEQAQAGHSAESVLKAMIASGWNEEVAVEALETTLRDRLEGQAHIRGLLPAVPVPDPLLDESPLYIDAGDRRVAVLQSMYNPRVVVFGSLLSDEECEQLIELAKPRLARSLTVATKTGGEEERRTDQQRDVLPAGRERTGAAHRTADREARELAEGNGEGLQILQYGPGAEYKPHYDYFDPAEPGTPTILKRGGQRVATLIMYLGEPEKGGGTVFPEVHMEVAPKRGNAVFFSYERAHAATRTLHGGAPVLAGEKWIATKWLRERRFE